MRLRRGDLVTSSLLHHRSIMRDWNGDSALVQCGSYSAWLPVSELEWTGETLYRLPWTRFGWRRLGLDIARDPLLSYGLVRYWWAD